jgi:hypothetical protein
MNTTTNLHHSRYTSMLTSTLMACLWGMFSYVHLLAYQQTGDWSYLLFCAAETLSALFFLIRTAPDSVSTDLRDWLLAIGATFAPFLFSPSDMAVWADARYLLLLGSALQLTGLLSLNRSFGLVAARREIKTKGIYRLIRHPPVRQLLYFPERLPASQFLASEHHHLLRDDVAAAGAPAARRTLPVGRCALPRLHAASEIPFAAFYFLTCAPRHTRSTDHA